MIKKTQNLEERDIRPLFPNMVTMLALACGVSSMQFAFWGNWSFAVVCIALAAIFDALDGRVARYLNISSKFGADTPLSIDMFSVSTVLSIITMTLVISLAQYLA